MKTYQFVIRSIARLFLMIFCGILLTNCDDDTSAPFSPHADEDVYVAGGLKETYYTRAVYWKNDVPVVLLEGPRASIAYNIFVDNSNIYVAGSIKDETYKNKPALWKNSTLTQLATNDAEGEANAVYVSENIPYVVGYEQHGTSTKAKLWIGDFSLTLKPNAQDNSKFNSVYVDNHKVYIAGYEYEGSIKKAKFWIYEPGSFSPTLNPLSDAQSFTLAESAYGLCDARSIIVKSNKIYVAGTDESKGTLWINQEPSVLYTGQGSVPESVFVEGAQTYVAGTNGDQVTNKPWYSKNGTMNYLTKGNADVAVANGIAKGKSNVYVSGYFRKNEQDWAVLWVNGVPKSLSPDMKRSGAHSVFVVEK